jgi:hypothetical protein
VESVGGCRPIVWGNELKDKKIVGKKWGLGLRWPPGKERMEEELRRVAAAAAVKEEEEKEEARRRRTEAVEMGYGSIEDQEIF